MLSMYQNGVRVGILPDGAQCLADNEKRSPLQLGECPNGMETCDGDCLYYQEEG